MAAIPSTKERHQQLINQLFEPLQPANAEECEVLARALEGMAKRVDHYLHGVPKRLWTPLQKIQQGLESPSTYEKNPRYQLQFLTLLTAKTTETYKTLRQPQTPPAPNDDCTIL